MRRRCRVRESFFWGGGRENTRPAHAIRASETRSPQRIAVHQSPLSSQALGHENNGTWPPARAKPKARIMYLRMAGVDQSRQKNIDEANQAACCVLKTSEVSCENWHEIGCSYENAVEWTCAQSRYHQFGGEKHFQFQEAFSYLRCSFGSLIRASRKGTS